jgi:hypothetical protein
MQQTTRSPEKLFERVVETGIRRALQSVEERYERAPEARDNLAAHNRAHTEGVVRRTNLILSTISLWNPESVHTRDIQDGQLAAAFHDMAQAYEVVPINDGDFTRLQRKRFVGRNEKDSTGEGHEYMRSAGHLFNAADESVLSEAIDAPIPEYDPESKTVVQPNLTDKSSLVARAVALADLGVAGMEGPDAFIPEGDALFREENIDIEERLREKTPLSVGQKEYFRGRMLAWCSVQSTFAEGRKARLEPEIAALPMPAREHVRALFDKFDDTIRTSSEKAEKRASMTFERLARDMGYRL